MQCEPLEKKAMRCDAVYRIASHRLYRLKAMRLQRCLSHHQQNFVGRGGGGTPTGVTPVDRPSGHVWSKLTTC